MQAIAAKNSTERVRISKLLPEITKQLLCTYRTIFGSLYTLDSFRFTVYFEHDFFIPWNACFFVVMYYIIHVILVICGDTKQL